MAKKITTLVNFVLDESSSMGVALMPTISGFNEYINSLKKQDGKFLLTLTQFSSKQIHTPFKAMPVNEVPVLDTGRYRPNGTTPLYDAIAQTISETDEAVRGMKTKPAVLCVIMTDGEENASKEFNRERIFKLIEQKTADGWTFAYIGANQDAWEVGASLGVPKGNTMDYDQNKTQQAFGRMAAATSNYAAEGSRQTRKLFGDD